MVPEFRKFVAEESRDGHMPGLDELLVIQYLLRHAELETTQAAALCQRPEAQMRNTLSRMERERELHRKRRHRARGLLGAQCRNWLNGCAREDSMKRSAGSTGKVPKHES